MKIALAPDGAELAWVEDGSGDQVDGPQTVTRKAANAFGVFDMIGNVWEWCWDYADTARYGDYRSLRGCGWADREWSCRSSVRRGSAPDAVLEDVGFRVARGPWPVGLSASPARRPHKAGRRLLIGAEPTSLVPFRSDGHRSGTDPTAGGPAVVRPLRLGPQVSVRAGLRGGPNNNEHATAIECRDDHPSGNRHTRDHHRPGRA